MNETEWRLQRRLTETWLADGAVLDGERLFLAAWEVMTDYRINDARRQFGSPSIDFLFLDGAGRMVALELKVSVNDARAAWDVLCQVSHRAAKLATRYSEEQLEAAYLDCHSGLDGRIARSDAVTPLLSAHAGAFGCDPLPGLPGVPIRRLVMAHKFGKDFGRILESFNSSDHERLRAHLGRYSPTRNIKRFLELPDDVLAQVSSPIRSLTVPETAAPGI